MTLPGRSRCSKFPQRVLGGGVLAQLLLLVLIVTEVRFPLPDFALASVKETGRKKGLDLQYKTISFTLSGTILAEGVILRAMNEKVPPW